jgi:hypothetical protein
MLFQNPDTDDVLSFLYVYEQIQKGVDMDELDDEIEKNREETGYAYPQEYKLNFKSKGD